MLNPSPHLEHPAGVKIGKLMPYYPEAVWACDPASFKNWIENFMAHLASGLSLDDDMAVQSEHHFIRTIRTQPWARFLAVGVEEHLKMPMRALQDATHAEFCAALKNFCPDLPEPVMFINCWYSGMA